MRFLKFYGVFFRQLRDYGKSLGERIQGDVKTLSAQTKKRILVGVLWLFAIVIVANPFAGEVFTSIHNQEFFAVHLRDLASSIIGDSAASLDEYYLATGTYEKQIDGPLFGVAQDKNLIVIQVEALQNIMIHATYQGQELTPNLNRLIEEQGSLYFDHYYQMLGSGNTSDSEFVTNNSYMGSIESYTYQLYEDNYFKGLPWLLRERGYSTAVFHGYDKGFWNRENIYPKLGFEQFINSSMLKNDNLIGLDGGNLVGISDMAFFEQSMDYIRTLPEPFYGFFITLSSHHPFKLPNELSKIKLSSEDQGTLFGDYINGVHYADQALGMFLDRLKQEGLYDKSLICIYGDHFGLPATDEIVQKRVSEFIGKDYKLNTMMNIPLIMHIPDSEVNETISLAAGQVDFLPTVSYLLGLKNLDTLYFGQNLLTATQGFVWEQTHLLKGSFITDRVVFEMARDGVISHSKVWDVETGEAVDGAQYEELSLKAKLLTELSNFYLKNDVLKKALKDGMSIEEILGGVTTQQTPTDTIYAIEKQHLAQVVDDFSTLTDQSGQLTLIATPTLNAEGEEGKIYVGGIIAFMEEHDDIKIMLDLGQKPIEILRGMKEVDLGENHEAVAMRANLMSRVIPVIHNFEMYTKTEYEGFEQIVVVPDLGAYSVAEMQGFLNQNKPFAVLIPTAEAEDRTFAYLLGRKDVFTFGYGADSSQRSKLKEAGFEGLMLALPQQ